MYRALRANDKLAASQPASWYLEQAARTALGMWNVSRWYAQMGLMVGSVFREVLRDLEGEDHPLAPAVRAVMYNRTAVGVTYYSSAACKPGPCACYNCTRGTGNATTDCPSDAQHARTVTIYQCVPWIDNPFPFGSEFAWDSTGQEETYVWGRYFGTLSPTREAPSTSQSTKPSTRRAGLVAADRLANITLTAILAYLPSVPHWAYNGAAWSWADTSNNAKWSDNRRVAGHYRVTLNALPVLEEFFLHPDDHYLLPVAIGAASQHMTTIDEDGATSMGMHLDPAILALDPYSGDFGIGLFGHVQMAASVFIVHPTFGPLCFLCDAFARSAIPSSNEEHQAGRRAAVAAGSYTLTPRDSIRRRVFLEPLGVLIEVDAGRLLSLTIALLGEGHNASTFTLQLGDDGLTTRYRVRISTPSLGRPALQAGARLLTPGGTLVRGAWEVPLSAGVHTLQFGLGGGAADDSDSTTSTAAGSNAAASRLRLMPAPSPFSSTAVAPTRTDLDAHRRMPPCSDTEASALSSASLPDHAHAQTQLLGSPPLKGLEAGLAVRSVDECAAACAAQRALDPKAPGIELRLRCQAWTFALGRFAGRKDGQSWCWLYAGRGNAHGNATACGFVSATCDNRPGPPSDWPCCQDGFSCPNPIV